MQIIVSKTVGVDCSNLPKEENNSKVSKGYSTMHPVQSPIMASSDLVIDWFNTNKYYQDLFKSTGHVCIYVHYIANEEHVFDTGYKASEGEILSTDEAYGWDWKNNKWVPWS